MHTVLSGASEGIMASLIPDPLIFDQSDKGRQSRQGYPGESLSSSHGFSLLLLLFFVPFSRLVSRIFVMELALIIMLNKVLLRGILE